MTPDPTLADMLVRLLLTMGAGALIGLNRGTHGHAAGLRTTILVGLAAAVAMVLADALLSTRGKSPGDFSTMDVMRMPLGILTGVGFIGGGAILKRGNLVIGLTTAATLWSVTVIGISFGAGALALGTLATLLSFVTLAALKRVENRLVHEHRAELILTSTGTEAPSGLAAVLGAEGCAGRLVKQAYDARDGQLTSRYVLSWRGPRHAGPPEGVLRDVMRLDGLVAVTVQGDEER